MDKIYFIYEDIYFFDNFFWYTPILTISQPMLEDITARAAGEELTEDSRKYSVDHKVVENDDLKITGFLLLTTYFIIHPLGLNTKPVFGIRPFLQSHWSYYKFGSVQCLDLLNFFEIKIIIV